MATLAANWLAQNGTGSLKGKDEQDLDQTFGLQERPPVVEQEVDQFLASGRVSEANLRRLLRRAEARLIIQGVHSDSGYSGATSARPRAAPQSARVSQAPSAPRLTGPPSAREVSRGPPPTVPEDDLLRWSSVARLACKEAELEALQKREAKKHAQHEIRTHLQHQIDEKNSKRQKAEEDEKRFCEMQDAELERWKRDQTQKAEDRLRQVQQVIRDRELQSEEVFQRREAEREQKLMEDKRLVQRACREMEKEQQAVAERRQQSRLAQAAASQEAIQNKQKGPAARQRRIDEEKQILQDYIDLLEKQEARRKATKPKIRDQSPSLPPRVKRKGEELYYDEELVRKIHAEAMARQEQAEVRKEERLKMERRRNQEFLSQQIAERDEQKRSVLEQKGGQKAAAQAAAEEARQSEKRRMQERRARYLQNRLELEGQMCNKKTLAKSREDEMSRAEKAINRRYVIESYQKTTEGLSPRDDRCESGD